MSLENVEYSVKSYKEWVEVTFPILDKFLKSDGAASCVLSYFNALRAIRSVASGAPDATSVHYALIDDAYARKSNPFYVKYGAALDVIYSSCVQSISSTAQDRLAFGSDDMEVILRQTAPELFPLQIASKALFFCAAEGRLQDITNYTVPEGSTGQFRTLDVPKASALMSVELVNTGVFR